MWICNPLKDCKLDLFQSTIQKQSRIVSLIFQAVESFLVHGPRSGAGQGYSFGTDWCITVVWVGGFNNAQWIRFAAIQTDNSTFGSSRARSNERVTGVFCVRV